MTAAHFSTRHNTETVDPRLEDVLDPIVAAFDEPFADPSAIPTYYVSKMARQHVTVALSGDGGDESFGGYEWRYTPHAMESKARQFMPGAAGMRAASWLGAHWPRSRSLPRPLRLGNVLENLGRDPAGAYYADLCFLKPPEARALLGKDPTRDPADSPVYEQVTAPVPRLSVGQRRSARAVRRPQGLHAERSAREGGSHEHGQQPRDPLSPARSPARRTGVSHSDRKQDAGRPAEVAA